MRTLSFDTYCSRKALKEKGYPLSVLFELTYRCNLDCVHCYIKRDDDEYRHKELNFDRICDILEQMAEAGVIYLNLTGGEPLLRPDFKDIYLFAKKKKLAVSILTNATLITEDMVRLFEEHPPLALSISNYGLSAQTYEGITRVNGSFECFQKAMDILNRSKVRFIVKFVIMKRNFKEIEDIKKISRDSSSHRFYDYYLVLRKDRDVGKNMLIKEERLIPEQSADFFRDSHAIFKNFRTNPSSCDAYIEGCGAGSIGFHIDPYGRFNICAYIDQPNIDLSKVRFFDAWKSCRIDKTPRMKKEIACGDCQFKPCCIWCPGLAYIETGSTEKRVPYLCQVMDVLKKDEEKFAEL